MKWVYQLTVLLIALCLCEKDSFAGQPSFRQTPEQFMKTAAHQWQELNRLHALPFVEPAVGVPTYVPLAQLCRGQSEISVDNIYAKIKEHLKLNDLSFHHHSWTPNHDSGRSVVPRSDAITVVKGPQGYVIVDGHHDVFLSLFVGAETIAVTVESDWSTLSPLNFWKTLKARNLIYLPETAEQLVRHVPDMMNVKDNPNRYLVTLLALKVQADFEKGEWKILKAKGSKNAVWVKLNNSIPFIEFYLSEVIGMNGIHYDPQWGTQVPSRVVEKIRYAFLHSEDSPHAELLKHTLILSQSESAERLDQHSSRLSALLGSSLPHMGSPLCGAIFSN